MSAQPQARESKWFLFIHQIPPKPGYLRVKMWRRLQELGAVPVKNSVYVVPVGEQTLEDLQWISREIVDGGGDATICEAAFIDGLTDAEVIAIFNAARNTDYSRLIDDCRRLDRVTQSRRSKLDRLKKRLSEITAIDFFDAPQRSRAETEVRKLDESLRETRTAKSRGESGTHILNQVWVTRSGIHVDRMASAWLIKRFIDKAAQFKFVSEKTYRQASGEIRFDMFEGEYTHEGNLCTFEVLLKNFVVKDDALRSLARIVHDIDLKDSRFRLAETAGIALAVNGIAMAHKADEERLDRAYALFDDIYTFLKRKEKQR